MRRASYHVLGPGRASARRDACRVLRVRSLDGVLEIFSSDHPSGGPMRYVSALLVLALSACKPDPAPAPAGSGAATASASAVAPELREAVRIDPTSFEATSLGRLRIAGAPPYLAEVVEGGDELRAIVAAMNGLDHVMSAGVSMPPQRVERSSTDFARIMEHGWLKSTHHVELRLPAEAPRPARRFDVWSARDGKSTLLGQVEVDAMDYVRIVGGPVDERAKLGRIVAERNVRGGESVDIPPPDGKEGKWGRLIARGTPLHFAMMRDALLATGLVLAPEGRQVPATYSLEGPIGRFADRRWLSAHVPSALRVIPPGNGVHLHLEGPPGGPLSFRALAYGGVKYDAASLRALVLRSHGNSPGFVEAEAGELELAGRKLLALTFREGEGKAAAARLVALWPDLRHLSEADEHTDRGVALELTIAAGEGPPKLADFAAHPTLGPLIDSLYVDLDAVK
jgi:hypothetical protein